MGVVTRQAHPLLEDVAFTISHDGDPCGCRAEQLLGCVGPDQPAMGFLLFDRQLPVVSRLALLTPPNLRMDETQARAVVGIHRQDWMQEQPDIGAIADRPEIVLAVGLGLVIDLGRILKSAHQAGGSACRRPQRSRSPSPNIIESRAKPFGDLRLRFAAQAAKNDPRPINQLLGFRPAAAEPLQLRTDFRIT